MSRTATILPEAVREALRLPWSGSVSEWADRHRILSGPACTEAGQWRTQRAPYLRGPMDAFGDPEVAEIIIVKNVQSGASEAMLNQMGYAMAEDPGPGMLVNPTEENTGYVQRDRLRPMIEASDEMKRHTTGRIWDLSGDAFRFDVMSLYFGSSNSIPSLRGKPVRYLWLDDVDAYAAYAGTEGDPVKLAMARSTAFWDSKIVLISTATTINGTIWRAWLRSNMQQYWMPCPRCGAYTIWTFEQLKLPKELRDPDEIIENDGCVWYECAKCGGRIEETEKEASVAAGVWVPEGQAVDESDRLTGKPKRSRRVCGFRYWAIVSPWVAWTKIMADWFEANTEEGIITGGLHAFLNNTLAKPYQETGWEKKPSEFDALRGEFSRGTVPADCAMLVAGADYHKSAGGVVRIDYEVRGFAPGLKNYVVTSGSVDSFEMLDLVLWRTPYPWADGTAADRRAWLMVPTVFVDSGDKPDDVYDWCLTQRGRAIPTKGKRGPLARPLQVTDVESATERRLSRRVRRKYKGLAYIGVDTHFFKDQVTGWTEPVKNAEGEVVKQPLTQFYAEIPDYYFAEFTNEHKVKHRTRRGDVRWVWEPLTSSSPTHFLDTAVLAAAAAFYKGLHYLRAPGERGTGTGQRRIKRRIGRVYR
ncbi:MAG TPA: hypothetical protein HPP87_04820 [Planctomycetes bacterium]|nr:hypothetical protein [Planctomycetota bacterium]